MFCQGRKVIYFQCMYFRQEFMDCFCTNGIKGTTPPLQDRRWATTNGFINSPALNLVSGKCFANKKLVRSSGAPYN